MFNWFKKIIKKLPITEIDVQQALGTCKTYNIYLYDRKYLTDSLKLQVEMSNIVATDKAHAISQFIAKNKRVRNNYPIVFKLLGTLSTQLTSEKVQTISWNAGYGSIAIIIAELQQ